MIDFLLRKIVFIQTAIAQNTGGGGNPFSNTGGGGNPVSNTGGGGNPIGSLPNPLQVSTIEDLFKIIANFLIQISIPIVAIMVIIGGFQILFAGGNPEKVSTGKKTILYSVVGFTIILLATSVIAIIKSILGTA